MDGSAHSNGIDLPALFKKLDLSQLWDPILKPMLIGAVPPAIVTGLIVYGITYYGVRGFQARRKAKLMDRARERMMLATENAPSV